MQWQAHLYLAAATFPKQRRLGRRLARLAAPGPASLQANSTSCRKLPVRLCARSRRCKLCPEVTSPQAAMRFSLN